MKRHLRTGTSGALFLLIMFTGSLGLWVGAPLLWLWVASQVQGATDSLGTALGVGFLGVVTTIGLLAVLLSHLSNVYRANRVAQGRRDPGHLVLEGVLVVSAAVTLVGFAIWFFLLSGAEPIPLGMPTG